MDENPATLPKFYATKLRYSMPRVTRLAFGAGQVA